MAKLKKINSPVFTLLVVSLVILFCIFVSLFSVEVLKRRNDLTQAPNSDASSLYSIVRVVYLNGGQFVQAGTTRTIVWEFTPGTLDAITYPLPTMVCIHAITGSTVIKQPCVTAQTNAGSNTYDLEIPSGLKAGTNYKIYVEVNKLLYTTATTRGYPNDYSDGFFTMVAAQPVYYWGPFDQNQIPIEVQGWWTPVTTDGTPIDGKGFGHVHTACKLPLGQNFPVSGSTNQVLTMNCRVVIHNNPSQYTKFRVDVYNDPGSIVFTKNITPPLSCPYNGVTMTQCEYPITVSMDTSGWKSGWHTLRLRAELLTPDSKRWTTSSEIPINIRGGSSTDAPCTGDCIVGKSWYGDEVPTGELGYQSAIIENAPHTKVKGTYTFKVKNFKSNGQRMQAFLDKSHAIKAVTGWAEEQNLPGKTLFNQAGNFTSTVTIPVDTKLLVNGWHSFSVRNVGNVGAKSVCSYCGNELNFQTGIAKIWFYVEN